MQVINEQGYQTELPDIWLTNGNPWEIRRPDVHYTVSFGGSTTTKTVNGKPVTEWQPSDKVCGGAAALRGTRRSQQAPWQRCISLWGFNTVKMLHSKPVTKWQPGARFAAAVLQFVGLHLCM